MNKIFLVSLLLALSPALNVHSSSGGQTMQLTATAFADGGKIPQTYVMPGAGGKNLSLPLSWFRGAAGAKSLRPVHRRSPNPVARNWVHWLVVDIPRRRRRRLAGGRLEEKNATGCRELKNSWGELGYGGPQPPVGTGDHPYVITLYALSVPKLGLKPHCRHGGIQTGPGGEGPGHGHPQPAITAGSDSY